LNKCFFLILLIFLVACSDVQVIDITENKITENDITEKEEIEQVSDELNETNNTSIEDLVLKQENFTVLNTTNTQNKATETEDLEQKSVTRKPEFIILIADDGPVSDVMWATELGQEIQFTALENKKVSKRFSSKTGFSMLYSEVEDLNQLSGRVSLVLYKGEAVVVIGTHATADDEDYQDMADYLSDLANTQKVLTSEEVKSKDFKALF